MARHAVRLSIFLAALSLATAFHARPVTFGRRVSGAVNMKAGEQTAKFKTELYALQRSIDKAEQDIDQLERDIEQDLARVLEPVIDLGVAALRIGTCALMVHHGIDKIEVSWPGARPQLTALAHTSVVTHVRKKLIVAPPAHRTLRDFQRMW